MRIFGSDRLDSMLQRFGLKEDEAIVHSWVNKALEKAQQKVEARNFDIRKNLLKFDNVMNDQRKVIFDQRIEWMREETSAETVTGKLMRIEIVTQPPPEDLPYMEAHKVDPSSGEDELSYANAPLQPAFAGNGNGNSGGAERNPRDPTSWGKVGRNEVCPCGS